jgi:PQQ-dependent dehydrogenase (methanol/ethanol family)
MLTLGVTSFAAAPAPTPSPTSTPSALVSQPSQDWPLYGGDVGNTRFSPAAEITPASAASLHLAWRFHTGVSGRNTSFESTATVADGRLFITAPDDEVFALDPVTGTLLWHMKPRLEADAAPTRINRGVAYGDGRVYLATVDSRLLALSAATGTQVWSTQLAHSQGQFFNSMAPQFADGRVIVGLAAGEHETRGFVAAYDADTGKQEWRFVTVPGPRDPGGASWPVSDRYLHGGGPVWMTPAIDPDLNLIYVCVTNPSPDFNGSSRAGMNLYTDSIVALRADTGHLVWYFQEVHHDLWDYDPASPPVLATVPISDTMVPAVLQAGKTGYLYVLDRRTGRPLVPTPERPAPAGPAWQHTWPTQPEPENQPFAPQCPPAGIYPRESCLFTPPDSAPALNAPGSLGGSAWSPVSYSPLTGLAYIEANAIPVLRSTTPHSCCFGRAPVRIPGEPLTGALVGYDVAAGRIAWLAPVTGTSFGGSAVTAGGVVFSGESSGYFDAHDARTGALLFQYATKAGADAGPTVYTAGGHEYVAIAVGGNQILNSRRGDTLEVFSLPTHN